MSEPVIVQRTGALATVTLNRPDNLNALGPEVVAALATALSELGADPQVRAVMLTGAGRAFSSGADLKDPGEAGADGKLVLGNRLRELYHPLIEGIREMPKPVIAAVNGPAVGVGCSLALACDLIVAAESSYFLLAFVNIGLIPDGGSTATVPARIGLARATEMAMLGERVPAAQALDWGLVNRVCLDDELAATAGELAERLAAGPTGAYAGVKRLLNRRLYAGLSEQLDAEADEQTGRGLSPDFAEGVVAFLQKRPPDFTGS